MLFCPGFGNREPSTTSSGWVSVQTHAARCSAKQLAKRAMLSSTRAMTSRYELIDGSPDFWTKGWRSVRQLLMAGFVVAWSGCCLTPRRLISEVEGRWVLESYKVMDSSGRVVEQPLGLRPAGALIYLRDGFMSVQIMSGTGDAVISYFGTYRVDATRGEIVHHV